MATYEFYIYAGATLPYDAANGTFTFDPKYDHATDRVFLQIRDDDAFLDGDADADEVGEDANQFAVASSPGGEVIAKGLIYAEQYAMLEGSDGLFVMIDRIEMDGQLIGYSSTTPLTPGVTYTYVGGADIDDAPGGDPAADSRMTYKEYSAQSVPCFGPGTWIATRHGPQRIEALRVGDLVQTLDHGPQPIRWIGRATVSASEIAANPALRPHLIDRGTAHFGAPTRPLLLSGNHRILATSPAVDLLFGTPEVLFSAKHLRGDTGQTTHRSTAYTHLLFDRHELICANGIWVESLFDGPQALAGLPSVLRTQVQRITRRAGPMKSARLCITGREAGVLFGFPRSLSAPPGPSRKNRVARAHECA